MLTVFSKSILTLEERLGAEHRYIKVRKDFILDKKAACHDLRHGG